MKISLVLLFTLISGLNFSQSKSNLIQHLNDKLLIEELTYTLFKDTINIPNDSLAYHRVNYFLRKKNNDKIIEHFNKARKLIESDKKIYTNIHLHFLTEHDSLKERWFNTEINNNQDTITLQFKNIANIVLKKQMIDTSLIPKELKNSFTDLSKYQHKKPIISAFLSTCVPGLGKLYNGRKYSFRNVFTSHLLLGGKFIEANYYLGILNPYTIITLGFFTTYYCANIVGSYNDLIEVKKEKTNQFVSDVKNYYLHTTSN